MLLPISGLLAASQQFSWPQVEYHGGLSTSCSSGRSKLCSPQYLPALLLLRSQDDRIIPTQTKPCLTPSPATPLLISPTPPPTKGITFLSDAFSTVSLTLRFFSCEQVYICGGFNGTECLITAEVYDAATNQWTAIAPMSRRRSGVGVVAYDDKVYAVREKWHLGHTAPQLLGHFLLRFCCS